MDAEGRVWHWLVAEISSGAGLDGGWALGWGLMRKARAEGSLGGKERTAPVREGGARSKGVGVEGAANRPERGKRGPSECGWYRAGGWRLAPESKWQ